MHKEINPTKLEERRARKALSKHQAILDLRGPLEGRTIAGYKVRYWVAECEASSSIYYIPGGQEGYKRAMVTYTMGTRQQEKRDKPYLVYVRGSRDGHVNVIAGSPDEARTEAESQYRFGDGVDWDEEMTIEAMDVSPEDGDPEA